jgi:hypothetical protein
MNRDSNDRPNQKTPLFIQIKGGVRGVVTKLLRKPALTAIAVDVRCVSDRPPRMTHGAHAASQSDAACTCDACPVHVPREAAGDGAEAGPDFLALGLGSTGMMGMLAAVARGRRAVGVEMRGDPNLGVHFNIREDWFHLLGALDQMMLERYGVEGLPRRENGAIFRLAECFYTPNTRAGDIVPDEVINGFTPQYHLAGTIKHVEYIDDRPRNGLPQRSVSRLPPPEPPAHPDPKKVRTDIGEVLAGPSTFQAGAQAVMVLLRRYLEAMERQDLSLGREPRVRLYTQHRVVTDEGDGFIPLPDGRQHIRIEELHELEMNGKFVRVRVPGSDVIDLGVPRLFYIAEGFHSSDAERLGFRQEDVTVDHKDGRGPRVAQADYVAGLIEILIDGRLRRRISSEFDKHGNEFWVRQIAVGHENDPEVGWILAQIPDFMSFDPVEAGKVPPGTDPRSPTYYAAHQRLVYDFYINQAAAILDMPVADLGKVRAVYGPKMFTLVERMGKDAQVAANGVVAGDTFGNGHFLTSGGAMTGMIGHTGALLRYFDAIDAGTPHARAIRTLADEIKHATEQWLHVSATEFSDAIPVNFGTERAAQIAAASHRDTHAQTHSIDASRRIRHGLKVLSTEDWRRPIIRPGRVRSAGLPELKPVPPVCVTCGVHWFRERSSAQPRSRQELERALDDIAEIDPAAANLIVSAIRANGPDAILSGMSPPPAGAAPAAGGMGA